MQLACLQKVQPALALFGNAVARAVDGNKQPQLGTVLPVFVQPQRASRQRTTSELERVVSLAIPRVHYFASCSIMPNDSVYSSHRLPVHSYKHGLSKLDDQAGLSNSKDLEQVRRQA